MATEISRRSFVAGTVSSLALLRAWALPAAQGPLAGATPEFEPWSQGFLDIHHISTGRGNAALVICPDGTSIMIDAGAAGGTTEAYGPARPNESHRPGEWIARYALRQLRAVPDRHLDYFVLSHFHADHMGAVEPSSPTSKLADYKLTGVTDVAELLPIRNLIDRGYPDYSYPTPSKDISTLNYIKFSHSSAQRGTNVQRFEVGSGTQIVPQKSSQSTPYPPVTIQNLAANGEVWTGRGNDTTKLFPDLSSLKPGELPTENACSIALRLSYGTFRYYTGGDLTCDKRFDTVPWMDVETPVSRVAGPVNVATLDHHGYFDATGPNFVRNMRARVYVLQSWHASHPALSVLDEIYSQELEPGPHDVFSTGIVPAAALADARLSDKMLSQHGHVVVRVSPGGKQYEVFVLDDTVENGGVLSRFGPYIS